MKNLYFLTQGVKLKRQNNQLLVYKNDKKVRAYPLTVFDNIYLFGRIEISTPLINFLLHHRKSIVFLSQTGLYNGILYNRLTFSNEKRRLNQYKIYMNSENRVQFAKLLIYEKLEKIENIFELNLQKQKEKLKSARTIGSILGIEGYASASMFDQFKKLLKEIGLNFQKRTYNPPPDEINSLLSSLYMFTYNVLIPYVISKGLDPYLGILHQKRGTHNAFVSDLMEVIRPELTFFAYEILKEIRIENLSFERYKQGYYLSNNSLKIIIEWIEKHKLENIFEKIRSFIKENFN
ncbi:CRISPR-associated endonuclease Cas1 [Persephonella sp.]